MTNEETVRALMHAVENDHDSGADTYSETTKSALAAVLARMTPVDWKAVPIEPTIAMTSAGRRYTHGYEDMRSPYSCYVAMLDAAPTTPSDAAP